MTTLPAWKKLTFGLVPLVLLLLLGELVARAPRGPIFRLENYRLLRLEQSRRGYPAIPDPMLGYAPQPSYSSRNNLWGTQVTIREDGLRSNGASAPLAAGRPIVAVGDSFTFGDQVDDDQTWPAYLEGMLGRPVHNGGVFGYSLTQAVLRGEALLRRVPAEWLIVSIFPEDLERSEFSKRYTWLPYFDVENGQLVLRNVPVTALDRSGDGELVLRLKHAFGFSALADAIFAHNFKAWWFGNEKVVRVHPEGRGAELALLMVDRLVGVCRERGCRLLFIVQGREWHPDAAAVLERARLAGAGALDLAARFIEEQRDDPRLAERYFQGHMTPEGNRWVASRIVDAIRAADSSTKEEEQP